MASLHSNGEVHGSGGLGINPPDDNDLRQFFGRNEAYYLAEYHKIAANAGTSRALFSWNWAAFLLSVPWCFYRRMATTGACLMFIPAVLWLVSPKIAIIGTPVVFAFLASLANYVYVTRCVNKLEAIYGDTLTQMQREDAIARRGGTSFSAYAVSIFIFALAWGFVPRGEGGITTQLLEIWQGRGVDFPSCTDDAVREQAGLLLRIAVRDRVPDRTIMSRFRVTGYKDVQLDEVKPLRTCSATVSGPGVMWRYTFSVVPNSKNSASIKVVNALPVK
jgi:hypothetical protein